MVLPVVESVTPNSGLPDGQDIVITGSGFSELETDISVEVDGVNCPVSASTITEIKCRLDARSSASTKKIPTNSSSPQGDAYLGGSGFKYYKYDVSSLSPRTYAGLKDAVDTSAGSITLLEEKTIGELETSHS